jgi:NACHT domain
MQKERSTGSLRPDFCIICGKEESLAKSSTGQRASDQMDSTRATIKKAYASTCEWLLGNQIYRNWINPHNFHDHHGFLWIWGKAGVGKSTLMKFAHAYTEKRKSENDIVISFFFNARGEQLEKQTTGMCRSLLFQLLQKAVDLQDVLDNVPPTSQQESQPPQWEIEQLCELLIAALVRLKDRRLQCFVDALDECDENQVREMINVFEVLGERAAEKGTQIYMMFASRPYPTIDAPYGQRLALENEGGHAGDVAKYVRSHLRAGTGKSVEEARSEICELLTRTKRRLS